MTKFRFGKKPSFTGGFLLEKWQTCFAILAGD